MLQSQEMQHDAYIVHIILNVQSCKRIPHSSNADLVLQQDDGMNAIALKYVNTTKAMILAG